MKDWVFKFPNYVSRWTCAVNGQIELTTEFKLFFVSYWLIHWFHGKKALTDMSARAYFEREMAKPRDKAFEENWMHRIFNTTAPEIHGKETE